MVAMRAQPAETIHAFEHSPEALEHMKNGSHFGQDRKPGGCLILGFPRWAWGYLIEIAGLSKGQ